MTDQPRHPPPRPGIRRHPRPPPAARRALTVLGALLLSLAAAAAVAPAASATPAPPEPPVGPPPPPPTLPAPGLPLWAVLVILGGTIALSAATTLITLALQTRRHLARPSRPNDPVRDGTPRARAGHRPRARRPPADPFAARPTPHRPSAARARGPLPLIPHHRRSL